MVNPNEFRKRIEQSITQEYKIEFLGKNFDQIVSLITDKKADKIYQWIGKVAKESIQPILISSKKKYKEWQINQLLTFRYPFVAANIEYRILFVKVKNSIYIEFHLGGS